MDPSNRAGPRENLKWRGCGGRVVRPCVEFRSLVNYCAPTSDLSFFIAFRFGKTYEVCKFSTLRGRASRSTHVLWYDILAQHCSFSSPQEPEVRSCVAWPQELAWAIKIELVWASFRQEP